MTCSVIDSTGVRLRMNKTELALWSQSHELTRDPTRHAARYLELTVSQTKLPGQATQPNLSTGRASTSKDDVASQVYN